MRIIVSNLELNTYIYLKAQAEEKGISLNKFIGIILNNYAISEETKDIVSSLKKFTEYIVTLYEKDHKNIVRAIEALKDMTEEYKNE